MTRTVRHILTFLTACLFSLSVRAVDADTLTSFPDQMLNQVVVTGTLTPKTLANTPVLTRVITSRNIERMDATNVKDVLVAELPGLEFSYAMNQQTTLTLQGMGGMNVLFLIDGERMAGETLDNIDFSRLSMDNVERIEIIKGAATALYGSNAVGAVINIITKQSSEPWSLHLKTRFANRHHQQRHDASFGFNAGRFNNMLTAQADGFKTYTVFNSDGDSTNVYGNKQLNVKDKLTFSLNDRMRLTARGSYYFHERDASTYMKDRSRDFSAGLRLSGALSDNDHLDASVSVDRFDKSYYYPTTEKDFLNYKNLQHIARTTYTHTFDKQFNATFGGDFMRDYLMSYQFSQDENHHQQHTADIFSQLDWKINKHWNIVGGLRGDYFSRHGWELTPKVTAMFSYKRLRLRGNYSRGFRAPTLKETYMNFNMANIFYIYGNQDLKSETSDNFSLGGEYTMKNYNFTLTTNYTDLDNKISTVWNASLDNGRGAMQYHNINGTRFLNVEATAAARYSNGIGAKFSYAFFHEFPIGDDNRTATTRPHSLTGQLDYDKKITENYKISATLQARYLSAATFYTLNDSYNGYQKTSSIDYSLWKLTFTQRFWNAINIILSVDNLFNYIPKTYEFNSPYTIGRTFTLGANVEIEQIVNQFK